MGGGSSGGKVRLSSANQPASPREPPRHRLALQLSSAAAMAADQGGIRVETCKTETTEDVEKDGDFNRAALDDEV